MNIGGLMRCCLDSLKDYVRENPDTPRGTRIGCKYHSDSEAAVMVLDESGTWRWVGLEEG